MDDEKIIEALNRITDAINSNESLTIIISIIAIVVPAVFTIITLFLTRKIDKNNKELQRQIHNRDVDNQTRQLFIDIYNSFSHATDIAARLKNANELFAFNTNNEFYNDLCIAGQNMFASLNLFYLLNAKTDNDEKLLKPLSDYSDAYKELFDEVTKYLNSPLYNNNFNKAWSKVTTKYAIQFFDYNSLKLNPEAKKEYIESFEDQYIETISKKAETVVSKFANKDTVALFVEHIKIKKM